MFVVERTQVLLTNDELPYELGEISCFQKPLKLDLLRIQMEENI